MLFLIVFINNSLLHVTLLLNLICKLAYKIDTYKARGDSRILMMDLPI